MVGTFAFSENHQLKRSMKLKLKTITYRGTPSCNQALALLVTLGTVTTGSLLLANDREGKYETRDSQSQRYAQEDVNAKTDPEKFVCHVAQSGIKEIRLANLAKQRAQSQEVKQFAEKLIQDHTKANQELKLIAQHQNIPWDVTEEKTAAAASGTARGAGTVDTPIISSEREIVRSTDRTPAEATATARGAGALDNSGAVVSSVNSTVDRETPAVANGTARGAYAANAQAQSVYADDQDDTYDRLVGLTGKSFDEAYMSHEVQCHSKAVAKFEKASRDLPDGELKQFVVSTLPTLREHLAMAQRMAPADTSGRNIRERTDRNSSSDQDQANK
jgi:putative membrane protein